VIGRAWIALALAAGAAAAGEDLPRASAAEAKIDPRALEELRRAAEESGSDALVVLADGKLVGEWTFGRPAGRIETMSVTKSIVALAVGRLLDAGKIRSLDQPVSDWFPEWKQGRKRQVTLRMLLEQTSGLQAERTTGGEVYPAPDFVQLALAAELADEPGSKFFYNNKATNLLAGLIERAAGKKLDQLVADEIFAPLGITDWEWLHDKAGNPHAMAGLRLPPRDLAKLGQLMLDGGRWRGKTILSAAFVEQATRPSAKNPRYGLLWWLLGDVSTTIDASVVAAWRKGGVEEPFIEKTRPLWNKTWPSADAFFADAGKVFGGERGLEEWYDHTWRRGLPDGKILGLRTVGFYGDGWLGQFVVVLPKERIVAVRMRRGTGGPDDDKDAKKNWNDFPKRVRRAFATPP
jgi:CubicO group peptidase (beta-lactamase class C family)